MHQIHCVIPKCAKTDFWLGAAPDPIGGAYDASPDSLLGSPLYPSPVEAISDTVTVTVVSFTRPITMLRRRR